MSNDIHETLSALADAEVPAGTLDLTARVRQRMPLPSAQRPARRMVRPLVAALSLALIGALALNVLPGQHTSSVSAAETLQRAEQVALFGIPGVESVHGIMLNLPATGDVIREELWVAQPGNLRKQIDWAGDAYEVHLQTSAGAWAWSTDSSYNLGANTVDALDAHIFDDDAVMTLPGLGGEGGPCSGPTDTLNDLGLDTLAGREVRVLECTQSDSAASQTYWIDTELFVALGYKYLDDTGAPFIEGHFTQFEINPTLPASLFELPN